MRNIFVVVLLSALGLAQMAAIRVPRDEVAKLVMSAPGPKYWDMAEAARIQGNVILEIRIDESGAAHVIRLSSGHPMLAPAAITAVNQWKHQPPTLDGKAAAVKSRVVVTFGRPSNHAAEDRRDRSSK